MSKAPRWQSATTNDPPDVRGELVASFEAKARQWPTMGAYGSPFPRVVAKLQAGESVDVYTWQLSQRARRYWDVSASDGHVRVSADGTVSKLGHGGDYERNNQ